MLGIAYSKHEHIYDRLHFGGTFDLNRGHQGILRSQAVSTADYIFAEHFDLNDEHLRLDTSGMDGD